MNIDTSLLISVGVFLGCLLSFEGLRRILIGDRLDARRLNRRMRLLRAGADPENVLLLLRRRGERDYLSRLPFIGGVPAMLRQAGSTMDPRMFIALSAVGSMAVGALAAALVGPGGAAVGALIAFATPILLLRRTRERRLLRLSEQLPDALDLLARSLRVGHPLNTSINAVAREMSDPIGTEFGVVADQVTYGEPIAEAIQGMSDRLNIEDLRYFSVSVNIQHGTGGNLARILNTLARVMRERDIMRRKIRAVSAEGRTSAFILSLMPVAVAALLSVVAPTYFGDVADDPLFPPMVGVIAILTVTNMVVLRRLVRFHI